MLSHPLKPGVNVEANHVAKVLTRRGEQPPATAADFQRYLLVRVAEMESHLGSRYVNGEVPSPIYLRVIVAVRAVKPRLKLLFRTCLNSARVQLDVSAI